MGPKTETVKFSRQHRDTLRRLVVDDSGPGTILHDFAALLAFVRERNLPLTQIGRVPPLKVLSQLNALLSHPPEVRLQRPQLKSYPHVQGLYLLLRATGLGQVGGPHGKQTLFIDQHVYDSWCSLNPTEQYFALLEAWLLYAEPEMVGDQRDFGFSMRHFADAMTLLHRAGSEGLLIADNRETAWFWNYAPGRMGFALLEMFGLLTVVARPPDEGEGWVVDRVYRTPLGEAIAALMHDRLFSDLSKWIELEHTEESSLRRLQPILAPYVREWKQILARPSWSFRPGRYEFKVSLARDLWRRIAISGDAPLEDLAGAILAAYEFYDLDHLDEFVYDNLLGVRASVHHPYRDEGPWTSEVRVGDVPLHVGQSMTYVFDFGDWWEFQVTLEQFDPDQEPPRRPELVEGHGEAPEQYPDWGEQE